MPSQKFCVISARQAEYLSADSLPDCRTHLHKNAREAREFLDTEYGPDRYVPCKFIHTGQQTASFTKERRKEASVISIGRKNFLIIEHLTSPQIVQCGGMVCVEWRPGCPPEQPKSRTQLSNGHPQRATYDDTKADFDKSLAAHRCQEL